MCRILSDQGKRLAPSETLRPVEQSLSSDGTLSVMMACQNGGLSLHNTAEVLHINDHPVCRIRYRARSEAQGWLVVSVRPYNPEGISFIHQIEFDRAHKCWCIDDKQIAPIVHGAKWIIHKRTSRTLESPHAGLLPAGFSAEHLGPNDLPGTSTL